MAIDKNLFNNLKSENKIYKVKSSDGSHFISCPECHNEMLCGWKCKKGNIFLCYNCGALFVGHSMKILKKQSGDKYTWDTKTTQDIISYEKQEEKFKGKTYEARKYEYANYLRDRLTRIFESWKIEKLSDEEILTSYQNCTACNEPMYQVSDEYQAIMEFETPEKAFYSLEDLVNKHSIDDHLDRDYQPLTYGEETWSVTGYPNLFISPEMREYFAKEISKMYKDWVYKGSVYTIIHDNDPPWDCSGEPVEVGVSFLDKINLFSNLAEWMGMCFTGESFPSYESGRGMYHELFFDLVFDFISGELWKLWTKKMSKKQSKKLLKELDNKELMEEVYGFEEDIMELIGGMSAAEALLM